MPETQTEDPGLTEGDQPFTSFESGDSPESLPVFEGDLAHWNKDMDTLRSALEHPDGYEYDAQLPEIIGYMTQEEAPILDVLQDGLEVSISDDEELDGLEYLRHLLPKDWPEEDMGMKVMRQIFPRLMALIEADIDTTMGEQGGLRFAELEKYKTLAGAIAKGTGHLHVDDMVGGEEDVVNTHYLLANGWGTLFYRGRASLFRLENGRLRLDTDSLEEDPVLVSAPGLAVIRTNGTTVHGSPKFEKDFSRAWMRISGGLLIPKLVHS